MAAAQIDHTVRFDERSGGKSASADLMYCQLFLGERHVGARVDESIPRGPCGITVHQQLELMGTDSWRSNR